MILSLAEIPGAPLTPLAGAEVPLVTGTAEGMAEADQGRCCVCYGEFKAFSKLASTSEFNEKLEARWLFQEIGVG